MIANRGRVAAVLAIVLSAGVVVLIVSAAILQTPRYVVSSGGGFTSNSGVGVYSSIGQPLSGAVSNGVNLCSGHLCGQITAPSGGKVFLPVAISQYCNGFPGLEKEDNDRSTQANGPICPNRTTTGSIYGVNENDQAANIEDWFYFEWSGNGELVIDVTSFLRLAGVFLYHSSLELDY